jgi:hypothetical protein
MWVAPESEVSALIHVQPPDARNKIHTAPMGTSTILMISSIILKKLTSMGVPASSFIHSGVISGAIIVVMAVTVTDSARFDFAM